MSESKAIAPKVLAPKVTKAPSAKLKPAPAPFVLESEGLTAFVEKNDSVYAPLSEPTPSKVKAETVVPTVKAPLVEKPVAEKPVIEKPVVEKPVVEKPVVETIAQEKAPTPPQPVVVEPVVAAIEAAAKGQPHNAPEGHNIMNEAIETSKKFAEDAKVRVQSMMVEFSDKAKSGMEKSSKTIEELSDIAKGNLEAIVESSKIAAKGVETLGQSAAEYGRASFEKTSATLKSFASVKSPAEFFQLQSDLMTSAFDAMASETAKSSEAMMKLAGEIAQPLSNRVSVVQEKLKSLAA